MFCVLRQATDIDRRFAEHVREQCYRDVVIRQFGAWNPEVQKRFFEEKWRPEHYSIIMFENEPIGVVAIYEKHDHLWLSEIQILPSHQGRGIGSAILADLIARARAQTLPLRLQVLRCSRAQGLYQRFGFICYGRTESHLLFEKSCG